MQNIVERSQSSLEAELSLNFCSAAYFVTSVKFPNIPGLIFFPTSEDSNEDKANVYKILGGVAGT